MQETVAGTPLTIQPTPLDSSTQEAVVVRHVIFWKTGFTIGDEPLLLYVDPQNAQLLDQINKG